MIEVILVPCGQLRLVHFHIEEGCQWIEHASVCSKNKVVSSKSPRVFDIVKAQELWIWGRGDLGQVSDIRWKQSMMKEQRRQLQGKSCSVRLWIASYLSSALHHLQLLNSYRMFDLCGRKVLLSWEKERKIKNYWCLIEEENTRRCFLSSYFLSNYTASIERETFG